MFLTTYLFKKRAEQHFVKNYHSPNNQKAQLYTINLLTPLLEDFIFGRKDQHALQKDREKPFIGSTRLRGPRSLMYRYKLKRDIAKYDRMTTEEKRAYIQRLKNKNQQTTPEHKVQAYTPAQFRAEYISYIHSPDFLKLFDRELRQIARLRNAKILYRWNIIQRRRLQRKHPYQYIPLNDPRTISHPKEVSFYNQLTISDLSIFSHPISRQLVQSMTHNQKWVEMASLLIEKDRKLSLPLAYYLFSMGEKEQERNHSKRKLSQHLTNRWKKPKLWINPIKKAREEPIL
ncbi:hypothetical protein SAMN05444392_11416 [Seinonella peptonophila]|uniref:Uncharacterized protein n=1 Tax=Seinonella peptonophila TaxID=112248 RepID=A0A1M5AI01_9BACL|nr:hypothetical protein [Seinonella peptonophila]SHF29919.1 hypothetical protein SAMN05444392_11416 [Seinonella peptonophila]